MKGTQLREPNGLIKKDQEECEGMNTWIIPNSNWE